MAPAHYALSEALRLWMQRKIASENRVQAGVARTLGVGQQRFHHWLTGHARIPIDKLNDIARYFEFADDAALIHAVRSAFPAAHKHLEAHHTRRPREGIWAR